MHGSPTSSECQTLRQPIQSLTPHATRTPQTHEEIAQKTTKGATIPLYVFNAISLKRLST